MIATRIPFRVPSSMTPTNAASAQTNSVRRIAQDVAEVRRLDQSDRIDDDDARQHRVRHEGEDRRQQQHRQDCHRGGDKTRDLGARTRHAIDRRLGHAATARHRPDQCAADVRCAGREQLAIGARGWLVGGGERTPGGDGLGEAHERDAERARPELLASARPGSESRQSGRDRAHQLDAVACHANTPAPAMAPAMAINGAGQRGPEFLDASEHTIVATPTASVARTGGKARANRFHVVQERAFREMDAEDLGQSDRR